MTVCLDTNVFLQIFGRRQPFYPILRALLDGRLTLAISTSILLASRLHPLSREVLNPRHSPCGPGVLVRPGGDPRPELALDLVALGRQSLGFEAFCLAPPKR
jgi:hypothetical protein